MHITLLIGLDGATFTVLDPLMDQGHMPNLKRLVAGGVRAELTSTPHPLTPPAWTTLMTGKSPGHHGIFDFLRAERRKGGAFFTLNNFNNIQSETIWTTVSRQGGRVTAVNFPLTAPPPKINGSIVPGLLSWKHLRMNVHPAGLYDEIKGLPGFNPKELSWDFESEKKALQNIPAEELETWVRGHVAREQHWFDIIRHIMTHHPAELTAVMFDGVDKLQHGCWRFLDPKYIPQNPTEFESRMRTLCIEYFNKLDRFIGELVELAGLDARVFIASDHGFGPTEKVFRVNTWLHKNGYLSWPRENASHGKAAAGHHVALDMVNTTAFAQSGATNGIHIRVCEEAGDGGVAPEKYEAFRERLIGRLVQVRDPESGQAMIKHVLKREDVFAGPHQDKAPDLTLVMHDHGFISVLRTEEVITTRPEVTGTHYPQGVLIAAGPGVREGYIAERQLILDTTATLLYSLGLPVPKDFESRVIKDVFEPRFMQNQPIKTGPATTMHDGDPAEEEHELDDEEEKRILNRLRALGYVE